MMIGSEREIHVGLVRGFRGFCGENPPLRVVGLVNEEKSRITFSPEVAGKLGDLTGMWVEVPGVPGMTGSVCAQRALP